MPDLPIRSLVLLVIAHPDGRQVLTRAGQLPAVTLHGSAYFGLGLPEAAAAQLGLQVTPLRRLESRKLPDADGCRVRKLVWTLELHGEGEGREWSRPVVLPPEQRPWVRAALTPIPAARPLWQRPGGRRRLMDWLDGELAALGTAQTGEPQLLKHSQISALWRVQAADELLYFKAVPGFLGREVSVTCWLTHELTGTAPQVLAADTQLGALLVRNAGNPLNLDVNGWGEADTGRAAWSEDDSRALLTHLAAVQQASVPRLDELRALGVPDRGPRSLLAWLPALLADPRFAPGEDGLSADEAGRFQAAGPLLEGALARLAASPLPPTLTHGDLHEGNVVRGVDGRFTLLDWSDAATGHPFLDANPAYLVPGAHAEAAANAYLAAWADHGPSELLRPLLQDALLVAEYQRILGYLDGILPGVEDSKEWGGTYFLHVRALLRMTLSLERGQPPHP